MSSNSDASKDISAFDVQALLDQAVSVANRKLEAAATAEAVLMHYASVRYDRAVLDRMAEKGVIPRAAVAGIKPAAELVDRKRDNNSHVDVALRGLETGQLPAGQFDWMVHGGDARSGQKENP